MRKAHLDFALDIEPNLWQQCLELAIDSISPVHLSNEIHAVLGRYLRGQLFLIIACEVERLDHDVTLEPTDAFGAREIDQSQATKSAAQEKHRFRLHATRWERTVLSATHLG